MNAAEAERIRERSASACRDNVGLAVADARYQTAILSTCSERHVSAISDLNEPDRHVASAGAIGSRWCGMWRGTFSARGKNKLHLRDMGFVGGPGDLAQRPGYLRRTRHFQWLCQTTGKVQRSDTLGAVGTSWTSQKKGQFH